MNVIRTVDRERGGAGDFGRLSINLTLFGQILNDAGFDKVEAAAIWLKLYDYAGDQFTEYVTPWGAKK